MTPTDLDLPAIESAARQATPATVAVYDHAIDCAWQDGVSDCDCNREAVSEVALLPSEAGKEQP